MTDEIENLNNLADQLIETGQKLREEATQKALDERHKELLIPEGKNILMGFTWIITLLSDSWWIKGTPATERAKALVAATQSCDEDSRCALYLQEQLNNIGKPYCLYMGTEASISHPIWCLASVELEEWLNDYSHLKFTNLSDTIEKDIHQLILKKKSEVESIKQKEAEVIKQKEVECNQLSELACSLRKIQYPSENGELQ